LLARLEPFGPENEEPTFVSRGLRVVDWRENARGQCTFKLCGADVSIKARLSTTCAAPPASGVVDVAYHLRRDSWRGTIAPEMLVCDWRISLQ
jgi:hypothetical protein